MEQEPINLSASMQSKLLALEEKARRKIQEKASLK